MNTKFNLTHISALHYDIFGFEGDMTIGALMPITAELNAYAARDTLINLVFDLSATTHIDSSGIRLLVNMKKKMDAAGKNLYLLRPSAAATSILEETNMTKVIVGINSLEEIERKIVANEYETYRAYTKKENGVQRLCCTCPICGSGDVAGYLLNRGAFDFRWTGDDPFPIAVDRKTEETVPFFSLLPIVCNECYMASIRIPDFNLIHGNAVAVKSRINDESKNLLVKSIKKRKKMMELTVAIGDNFFENPRDPLAVYKAYELAQFCTRTVTVLSKGTTLFDVGYLDFLAIQYAEPQVKELHINNCRTWFTQAMSKPDSLSTFELAVSYFVLIVANMNLEKMKEAAELYADFGAFVKNLPPSVPAEGFAGPQFWYKQVTVIWEKEIESQSQAMKIRTS